MTVAATTTSTSSSNKKWLCARAPQSLALAAAYLMLLHAALFYTPSWVHMPLSHIGRGGAGTTTSSSSRSPSDDDHWSAMSALVEPHGSYQLQEHFVTTADGFILRLFRIQACATNSTQQRPVVFLQHALMDSSAGWLLLGPQSLALQLVDSGFDVWLGNARGNRYSRNHTSLQPSQPEFWAWSWQQQAEHDLPASISHVLAATQQQTLVLIGYSQGTMTALAALSTQPQLAASVSLALLLAPVAFTSGLDPLQIFALSSRLRLDTYGLRSGWTEWGSHQKYWGRVCAHVPQLCLHFLTAFCGKNPTGNVRPELVPSIFQHLPAGTSVQNLRHWAQGIRRRDTRRLHTFDYGSDCRAAGSGPQLPLHNEISTASSTSNSTSSTPPRCNQHAYNGQERPPFYDMSAITTPVALFSGGQDTMGTLADVELLKQQLQAPGILRMHQHFANYGHLDFTLGSDAPTVLYPTLIQLALQFSGTASIS